MVGMMLGVSAQDPVFTVAAGTTHVILAGTVVSAAEVVLTPTADFSFDGTSLTRNNSTINTMPLSIFQRGINSAARAMLSPVT